MFSQRVRYAIQALAELEAISATERYATLTQLKERCSLDTGILKNVLRSLCKAGYADYNFTRKQYTQAMPLSRINLHELVMLLDGGVSLGGMHLYGWSQQAASQCETAIIAEDRLREELEGKLRDMTLAALLRETR